MSLLMPNTLRGLAKIQRLKKIMGKLFILTVSLFLHCYFTALITYFHLFLFLQKANSCFDVLVAKVQYVKIIILALLQHAVKDTKFFTCFNFTCCLGQEILNGFSFSYSVFKLLCCSHHAPAKFCKTPYAVKRMYECHFL